MKMFKLTGELTLEFMDGVTHVADDVKAGRFTDQGALEFLTAKIERLGEAVDCDDDFVEAWNAMSRETQVDIARKYVMDHAVEYAIEFVDPENNILQVFGEA